MFKSSENYICVLIRFLYSYLLKCLILFKPVNSEVLTGWVMQGECVPTLLKVHKLLQMYNSVTKHFSKFAPQLEVITFYRKLQFYDYSFR